MPTANVESADTESLLSAARRGDERAYLELVEGHRSELHAHCYRMLASLEDADDAVQEALTRAWRGLARFEARSSVRTWLFKIATNVSLDMARRRKRRAVPLLDGRQVGAGESPGEPLVDVPWIQPYPLAPVDAAMASPEARYELHEALELAFVVAIQHLPPRQRAVLILREVLGYSAEEVAGLLDTTVSAVNSALQRARSAAASRLPRKSQQAELRSLGPDGVRELAQRYARAIEQSDIDTLLSMLTEDATWSMPPLPAWYQGRDAIAAFHVNYVMPEHWRHVPTFANGQLAVGGYILHPDRRCYVAAALDVIMIEEGRVAGVIGFLRSEIEGVDEFGLVDFRRFGLPPEMPA
jgi:RNA polymerase sigma-70 factor (ECF subfamily)